MGYSPGGHKESDTTEQLTHSGPKPLCATALILISLTGPNRVNIEVTS